LARGNDTPDRLEDIINSREVLDILSNKIGLEYNSAKKHASRTTRYYDVENITEEDTV
jgi:hypothetical protein